MIAGVAHAIKLKGEQQASARLQFQRVRDEQGALDATFGTSGLVTGNELRIVILRSWPAGPA